MMRVDEALLMRWKDRLCDEIDEIYHEENWTPQHAKSMKEMLSSVEKIICIIKCAKEMDESGMQGGSHQASPFFIFQNNIYKRVYILFLLQGQGGLGEGVCLRQPALEKFLFC